MNNLNNLVLRNNLIESVDFSITSLRDLTNIQSIELHNNNTIDLKQSSLEMLTNLRSLAGMKFKQL